MVVAYFKTLLVVQRNIQQYSVMYIFCSLYLTDDVEPLYVVVVYFWL